MQAVTASDPAGNPIPVETALRSRWRQFAAAQMLVLLAGMAAIALVPQLPPGLAGLSVHGPFLCIALALALALPFNRGRAALAAAGLGVVYTLFVAGALAAPGTLLLTGVLVPLDIAVLALLRERGALSRYAARRAGVILLQGLAAAWLVSHAVWSGLLAQVPHLASAGGSFPPPLLAGTVVVALLATGVIVWLRGNAIDAALCGSVAAMALAFWLADVPNAFAVLTASAALGIAIGVLQDAHRFAFVDELTGLPSRRALEEKLLALPDRYAIAMVDVDHFKRVNDVHGHDTGDQVLRMIAVHLSRVGGGARVYRYGGEEFTVVFAGRSSRDAVPHLERLRLEVASYVLQLRAEDRPAKSDDGARARGRERRATTLGVTISIGVAERDGRNTAPAHVLRAADQALYRAKERGRNRISR